MLKEYNVGPEDAGKATEVTGKILKKIHLCPWGYYLSHRIKHDLKSLTWNIFCQASSKLSFLFQPYSCFCHTGNIFPNLLSLQLNKTTLLLAKTRMLLCTGINVSSHCSFLLHCDMNTLRWLTEVLNLLILSSVIK